MPLSEAFTIARLPSPIGVMLVITDSAGVLRALDWEDHAARMHALLRRQYGPGLALGEGAAPTALRQALADYFDGALSALDALPVVTAGTQFQREVWAALRQIPAGTTESYGALAKRIGRPACGARGRRRQRRQSRQPRPALPSRHRRRRHADGVWRRPRAQALAARA